MHDSKGADFRVQTSDWLVGLLILGAYINFSKGFRAEICVTIHQDILLEYKVGDKSKSNCLLGEWLPLLDLLN